MHENLWDKDVKFLKNTLRWVIAHPERNPIFNARLKPIRREILANLELNITQNELRYIDFDAFKSYFWAYFEKGKNIPINKLFKAIKINFKLNENINVDAESSNIDLASYLKILNSIRSNISVALLDMHKSKETFLNDDIKKKKKNREDTTVYSSWEESLAVEGCMPAYNAFLKKKFDTYKSAFKKWNFELESIVYYYVLKNKFKSLPCWDISKIDVDIGVPWACIKLPLFVKIMEMLNVADSPDIVKKS